MKNIPPSVVCATFLAAGLAFAESPVSRHWEEFKNAQDRSPVAIMPDFSYAGYQQGEKAIPDLVGPVFKVTDYGAIADDDLSDEEAIRSTIAAAEKAGGGVVLFPPGKFLVWTQRNQARSILIQSPNIVIRGAGSSAGGTVVRAVHSAYAAGDYAVPKAGSDFERVPYIFVFKAANEPAADDGNDSVEKSSAADPAAARSKVVGSAKRSSFKVELQTAVGYKPGEFIQIRGESKKYFSELLADLEPDATWTRIQTGINVSELHQIASVNGSSLTLKEPLLTTHGADFETSVVPHPVIQNVGIEDIAFQGSWYSPFVHHRSALDDEGWDAVLFNGVAHGWVLRCAFLNLNTGVYLRNSLHCSLLENRFSGNKGHYNVAARSDSSFNLLGLSSDSAGQLHSMSTGNRSAGTTVWRWTIARNQSVDSHGNNPFATLIDCVKGGRMSYSGGPASAFPNHLRWMIYWNFDYAGDEKMPVDLWKVKRGVAKFVKPLFVGLHGEPISLVEAALEDDEFPGVPVAPESLYEAQLALRLGELPAWVPSARQEWEALQSHALSPHEAAKASSGPSFFQTEPFPLSVLLEDLRGLLANQEQGWSLALELPKSDTDSPINIETDYVTLRSIFHGMATFASDGQLVIPIVRVGNDSVAIEIPVTSGDKHRTDCQSYLETAQTLAKCLGCSFEVTDDQLVLTIPVKFKPH